MNRHFPKDDTRTVNNMKRWSMSLLFMEIQTKTTSYYYTPPGMTKILKTDNTKCWRGRTLIHCEWEGTTILPFWKCLAASYKVTDVFIMQPCKSSPKYLPKRNENMPIQMYVHVFGSFIHNHHLKTAQMFFKR